MDERTYGHRDALRCIKGVRAAISRTEWASSGGEGKKPTTAINPSGIVRKRLEREEENSFGRRRQTTSSSFGAPAQRGK
jgi:hypothetical protein